MKRKAMRKGGSESFCGSEVDAPGDIASSHGSDSAAPAPRSKVRREIGLNMFLHRITESAGRADWGSWLGERTGGAESRRVPPLFESSISIGIIGLEARVPGCGGAGWHSAR